MGNPILEVFEYKEVLAATNIGHWPRYIRHSYFKRSNDLSKYSKLPSDLRFRHLSLARSAIDESLSSDEVKRRIVETANLICGGVYPVFDVRTQQIKGKWHTDLKTGEEWPRIHYQDVRKEFPQGSVESGRDIKYAWELGCMHFLLPLAQAYYVTGHSKYMQAYIDLLEDWSKDNPCGIGVNWCCTMDVALRSINVIVSAAILNEASEDFAKRFQPYHSMLYEHMQFIADNLEFGFVRENHFLANVVGLKLLGQCFSEMPEGRRQYRVAVRHFRRDLLFQIYPDGTDHEASTCYHWLVFELILLGLAVDARLLSGLSRREKDRLGALVSFSKTLCAFSSYPIVGDNDSERVLDVECDRPYRKCMLAFSDALLYGLPEKSEYSFLLPEGCDSPLRNGLGSGLTVPNRQLYSDSGYYYSAQGCFRLLIHSGSIGRRGRGGHGHNDQTSFVLDAYGDSLVVDPGSFVYEADLRQRNLFRGTGIHNCIFLEGVEQNSISWNTPFKMKNETKATMSETESGEGVLVTAGHSGYSKNGCAVRRDYSIEENRITISDHLSGSFRGTYSLRITFHPKVSIEAFSESRLVLRTACGGLVSLSADNAKIQIDEGWYSPSYATKIATKCACVSGCKSMEEASCRLEFSKIEHL